MDSLTAKTSLLSRSTSGIVCHHMPIKDNLGPEGAIAKTLGDYEERPQQLEMASAVEDALQGEHHLMVEAGTGVGKTFAYLIPAIEIALATKRRVVVSTHTIALQEQLINKDIPFLQASLGTDFRAVLVKGRANYLGLRRMARTSKRQSKLFASKSDVEQLWQLEDWAYRTADGSLADLDQQPKPSIWDRIASDGDDCLGRKCEHYSRCFYQRARSRAADANVLIVNHALLFSDIALRQEGAAILPDYDYVILDEAHTVEAVAGSHLGTSVSSPQLFYLLNSLYHERTQRGVLRDDQCLAAIRAVESARALASDYFDKLRFSVRIDPGGNYRFREPPSIEPSIVAALTAVKQELQTLYDRYNTDEAKSEINGFIERIARLIASLQLWHEQQEEKWVYWLSYSDEQRERVTLASRPIQVGPILKATLFDKIRSVICTSATLAMSKSDPFKYMKTRLGLEEVTELQVGSPFDYRNQMTVYVESKLPVPSTGDTFLRQACESLQGYLNQTKGGALVLFTSYEALRRIANMLAPFCKQYNMPLLIHGDGTPRSKLLDQLRSDPRSVLLGTDTFWAGIDVPGDALRCVAIMKLPFLVPSDPVVAARSELIESEGGNAFMSYHLPEAILKFRQGVGRLIRTKRDRGIVVILDSRIRTKTYGRRFLSALPDAKLIDASQSQM